MQVVAVLPVGDSTDAGVLIWLTSQTRGSTPATSIGEPYFAPDSNWTLGVSAKRLCRQLSKSVDTYGEV